MPNPNDTLGGSRLTVPISTARDPWQEVLERLSTVPASKVVEAAAVVEGLAGSWAGSFVQGAGGFQDDNRSQAPSPTQFIPFVLGRPGMPEINFPPYAAHTNRMGSKGGALVGHPISFSVVGPTPKNRLTNRQWVVTDNSGTPDGDILELDSLEAVSETLGNLPGAFARTIEDLYGISSIGEHLYIYITQTGAGVALAGPVLNGIGGLSDGFVNTTAGRVPVSPSLGLSMGELFRVVGMDAGMTQFILDPSKRLADYFTIPAAPDIPVLRGVTLVQPMAARCVGLPETSTTRDPLAPRAFVIVPPERALTADQQYPLDRWTGVAFQEDQIPLASDGTGVDVPGEWRQMPRLPVPKPLKVIEGRLWGESGDNVAFIALDVGPARMKVALDETGITAGDWVGKIINIREVKTLGAGQLVIDVGTGWQADVKTLSGWFEVVEWLGSDSVYVVRRIDEWDPTTGMSFWGPSLAYELEQAGIVAGDGIHFTVSVHEPLGSLWTSTYLDWDALDSARLTNIINPEWVERSLKVNANSPGAAASRPDRAAISTASGGAGSYADPGNLYDLGFRAILYPAKDDGGGNTVPDFDRPVDSNEVLLDPSADPSEKQWVEVDYANGIVRLSHAPAAGGALWPTTDSVFANTDNPRKETVIFISCVPYSMESGQMGTGARVTGSTTSTVPGDTCLTEAGKQTDHADAYGSRLVFPVVSGTTVRSSVNGALGGWNIQLDGLFASQIPQAGFVEILQGEEDASGAPVFSDIEVRAATWGYVGVDENAGVTRLHNIFGGARSGVDNWIVGATAPLTAVIRRDITTPANATGRTLVDYQHDTTYGRAKRAQTLRFEDSEVLPNVDGSVSVRNRQTLAKSQQALFDDLFTSGVLEGGVITSSDLGATIQVDWTAMTILYRGQRLSLPAGSLTFADGIYSKYIYVSATPETGAGCHPVSTADSLPLVTGDLNPNHILLGLVANDGTGRVTIDLRNILQDIDQRVDIFVGAAEDMEAFTPHFSTLAAAVAYANEIQNPTSGEPGRKLRIRVIGYTQEADADLPIVIKTNGLVIEGGPRLGTDPTDLVQIRWAAEDKHLIDLNGYKDLEFSRLSFYCGALTSPVTVDRCVFVDTSNAQMIDRLYIHDCRSRGTAQGFFYRSISAAGDTPTGIRIEHNDAQGMLDFGILFASLSDPLPDNLRIVGNTLIQGAPGNVVLAYRGGVSLYTDNEVDPYGENALISGNTIEGFLQGIYTSPMRASVCEDNNVESSETYGILSYGWDTGVISRNYVNNAHTSGGGGFGLVVDGVILGGTTFTATQVAIEDNFVHLDTPPGASIAANGFGIHLSRNRTDNGIIGVSGATTRATLDGDQAPGFLITSPGTLISHLIPDPAGTTIDLMAIQVRISDLSGDLFEVTAGVGVHGGSLTNCRLLNATILGSDWLIDGCHLTGQLALGYSTAGGVFVGTGCQINDCYLGGTVYLGSRIRVDNTQFIGVCYVTGESYFSNNYFANLLDYNAVPGFAGDPIVSDSGFHNNYIGTIGTFRSTGCMWHGNRFAGGVPLFTAAGGSTGNVFGGNKFSPAVEFATTDGTVFANVFDSNVTFSQDTPNQAITGNVVAGNMAFTVNASGCTITGNRVVGNLGAAGVAGTVIAMGNRATNVFGAAPPAGPKLVEVGAPTPFNVTP